ncbi:DUF4145 domain-containing protein, partial [Candidatus Woesearchaeota archaeon]|nr:DUF4145 domain-containing protein [Candidatus Woesearchaeota archaeon]
MRSEKEIRKIICPKCNVETNHKQVWNSGNLGWTDEDSGMWEKTEYRLFQCMGCETPTLSKTDIFSEDLEENVKLWPNRPNSGISTRAIKIIYDAPPVVKRIYRETIEAFNLELTTLCAAGIRVIIEAICREENADGKDLKEKIDSLKNKGIISEKLCEGLQT